MLLELGAVKSNMQEIVYETPVMIEIEICPEKVLCSSNFNEDVKETEGIW